MFTQAPAETVVGQSLQALRALGAVVGSLQRATVELRTAGSAAEKRAEEALADSRDAAAAAEAAEAVEHLQRELSSVRDEKVSVDMVLLCTRTS